MKDNSLEFYFLSEGISTQRKSLIVEVKKYNKDGQICYFDSIDFTDSNYDENTLERTAKLISNAGFEVNIIKSTFNNIIYCSTLRESVELYYTDESILKHELHQLQSKIKRLEEETFCDYLYRRIFK